MDESRKKVIATINSCTQLQHLGATRKLVFLYLNKFNGTAYDNNYNALMHIYEIKKREIIKTNG